MDQFTDRVAVVTGAGSGMGKAFAVRWAQEGMKIVAADIDQPTLDATVAELNAAGHQAIGVRTDVSDAAAVQHLAVEAVSAFGGVHILCNNAGVEGFLAGAIWEATEKDWTWTVDVNYWSVVNGLRSFVPLMLAQDEPAHIVNTASMTAVISASNMYGITKHAVLALSEVLNNDLRERNAKIGVTALCPGTIATNLFHGNRNRPEHLRNDAGGAVDDAAELREKMHAILSEGMSPDEVANRLVDAVRRNELYLLTDHDWDDKVIARHEAILAGAVGDLPVAGGVNP